MVFSLDHPYHQATCFKLGESKEDWEVLVLYLEILVLGFGASTAFFEVNKHEGLYKKSGSDQGSY